MFSSLDIPQGRTWPRRVEVNCCPDHIVVVFLDKKRANCTRLGSLLPSQVGISYPRSDKAGIPIASLTICKLNGTSTPLTLAINELSTFGIGSKLAINSRQIVKIARVTLATQIIHPSLTGFKRGALREIVECSYENRPLHYDGSVLERSLPPLKFFSASKSVVPFRRVA